MNFVAKCCQPPGILGDFAVDRWKFIDFTRPGILRPSPVWIKNGIAQYKMRSTVNFGSHSIFSKI